MYLLIKVEYTGAANARKFGASLPKILKAAWWEAGRFWHATMRPKHFRPSAMTEYGYAKRTPGYLNRKRRSKGHQDPLTWRGESKRATEKLDVRATSKGCRVVMRAPNLNWRDGASSPDMRKELTTVTQVERKQIIRHMQKDINGYIRGMGGKTTVTVGEFGGLGGHSEQGFLAQLYADAAA